MLDLTDGVSGLVGQSLEAHPDQDGATDVVSLDARPAALAGLDIVAEAPGVLGKVRQRVVDLRTQQKLAVVQTGNA